jgi:quercetin dioxygenase-like cupin family protein
MSSAPRVAVLDVDEACPRLAIVAGPGEALAMVWPGVGARMRSMHLIRLAAGSTTVPLRHPMEAVYAVIAGAGRVRDPDAGTSEALVEGSIFHVEPGTAYAIEAGAGGIELVGGPCPADPALYENLAAA